MIIGETITKRYFLYSEEMLVINSAIMILSGVLMFVGRYFSENWSTQLIQKFCNKYMLNMLQTKLRKAYPIDNDYVANIYYIWDKTKTYPSEYYNTKKFLN